jgi:hypothetical protein
VHNPGVRPRCFQRLAVVALLSAGLASGCDLQPKACNEIGCRFGFAVDFQPTDGVWRPGRYLIDVTADGVSSSCESTLPFPPCGELPSTCIGQRSWILGASGCALPASQHSISGISFSNSPPATVEVTVSRDGRQLASQTFTPTYVSSRPNGPDCEPTCRTAPTATLALLP